MSQSPRLRSYRRLVVAAAMLSTTLTACGDDAAAVDTDAPAQEARRIINVGVERLQVRSFTDVIRLTGTVVADRSVMVAAEEGGIVQRVLVDKGASVQAGQPIVELDDEMLRAQQDEAQAQLSLAQQLWDRTRRLYDDDGIGTENEYLQARYNAAQAKARLTLVEARLANTTIRAPFDGVLDARHVEVGSVVAPGSNVATVVDLSPLKVAAGVPERYAADVQLGARAVILFDALGDTSHGSVEFVGASVHVSNRTFPIELALDASTGFVKPEMVADVILERRHLDQAVVVPRQALVRTESGFSAFVAVDVQGDAAIAEVRALTLGPSAQDEVVVVSGLSDQDRLIVLGQTQVAHGDHLRTVRAR